MFEVENEVKVKIKAELGAESWELRAGSWELSGAKRIYHKGAD